MPTSLPLLKILKETFQWVWDKRLRFLRALLIPALAIIALSYLPDLVQMAEKTDESSILDDGLIRWLIIFIQWTPYVLFAITCHRLALMRAPDVPAYGMLKWTRRESQFMGWILIIIIIYIASYSVIYIPLSEIFGESSEGITVSMLFESPLEYVSYILAMYIFSRLSLLYPATALNNQVNLQWAWALSRNNGWRLTLLIGGLPFIR